MALNLDQIRAIADRVAASHGLDVVDIEYQGAGKHRVLRVFIEKNAQERARLKAAADAAEVEGAETPSVVDMDQLAFVTHTDCEGFSRDFGTVLDVEELVPGTEYTLEISSPGLDRKLHGREDYVRFRGSLIKLQTYEAVAGNRHWQGRLTEVSDSGIVLDLSEAKQKSKGKKKAVPAVVQSVEIELGNVEKASLVPEIL
jgi:ribosome maturation factor RimP